MSLAEQDYPAALQSEPSLGDRSRPALAGAMSAEGESAFLARLLIESTSLSCSALDGAIQTAQESRERFETVLTRSGLITERDLADTLVRALNLPLASAKDFPDAPVLEGTLSRRFLWDARLIPLKEDGDAVTIAMLHPLDTYAVEAMRFACGKRVERMIAYPVDFEVAFKRLYGETVSETNGVTESRTRATGNLDADIAGHADGANDAPLFVIGRWLRGIVRVYVATASKVSEAQTALRQAPKSVRRTISLGLVAAVHLFTLWLLANSVLTVPKSPAQEIGMAVLSLPASTPQATLPPPDLASPALVESPAPDIEIASEEQSDTLAPTAGEAETIAPRPDPAHPNDAPGTGGAAAAHRATETVLKIFVLTDGTIGDAMIVKSCGVVELDALALSFVKTHWRYLPATLAGQAIEAWTTVLVPFR